MGCLLCICKRREHKTSDSSLEDLKFYELPARVREKIFRFLDPRTKLAVREVCSKFRSEIDFGVGLSVNVDDKSQGNLEFIKSIEATSVSIYHIKDSVLRNSKEDPEFKKNIIFRCKQNVQNLDIWCWMTIRIFSRLVLPLSENLVSLTFHSMAFMTQYINIFPPEDDVPFNIYKFPVLQSLIIHYGYFNCPLANFQKFNDNMRYLLRTLYSPVLREFRVYKDAQVFFDLFNGHRRISHPCLRWESHPLKLFIEKHRLTLVQLELFFYRDHFTHEEQFYKIPGKILEYRIFVPLLVEAIPNDLIGSYYQKILECQNRLSKFSITLELWGRPFQYFNAISNTIIPLNYNTLREIRLFSFHRKKVGEVKYDTELDFSTFGLCTGLRIFEYSISKIGHSHGVVDGFFAFSLNSLPISLRVIELRGIEVLSRELESITRYKELRHVVIVDAGTEHNRGITFEVARGFLTHRKIQYVHIRGFNQETDESGIHKLIDKFDGRSKNEIEVENPYSKITCSDRIPCCRWLFGLETDRVKLN